MFNYLTGVVQRRLAPVNHIDYCLQRHQSLIRSHICHYRKGCHFKLASKVRKQMFKIEAHQVKVLT